MKRPIRIALASLLALPFASPIHAQRPSPERFAASIDSFVQAEVLARGITGVSLVVARGDEPPIERSWGLADTATQRRADNSTAYRIGAISKQFTAALLLKQVDRGRLSLNDTIGHYLAGLKPVWNRITIEQILNHTGALPRDWRVMSRAGDDMPRDSLFAMAARATAPRWPAGAGFAYSDTGYMLLAVLVEKLYGKSYGDVLRDEIARPLGLATLGWCGDREVAGRVAKAYHRTPAGTLVAAPYIHPSQMLAGGICSSAGDIARWNRALHGGKVLSAASYAAMITPRGAAATAAVPYGLGLYVRPTPGGGTVIVHDGTSPGYTGENVWYPAEGLSVTMFTNTTGRLSSDINLTEAIGRIALGRPPVPVVHDAPPAPAAP
ncbi:MAG TPA: serine hydrolase domain-containing protein [Longimicrobium sp.]|jgi:CubicO group peptidase (beta-lactamase class C family)